MVKLLLETSRPQCGKLSVYMATALAVLNLILSRSGLENLATFYSGGSVEFLSSYWEIGEEDVSSNPVLLVVGDTDNDDDVFRIDRVQESPIPNPPLADGNTTMSACLLIMDDNHRLVEWMAYHYYVLPLRYLIVAVDPRSRTSPTLVLNRWRKMGVHIMEWGDEDIWIGQKVPTVAEDAEPEDRHEHHQKRQQRFYQTCLRQAKVDDRSWVTLHDTDEYVVYSHRGGEQYEEWDKEAERLHQAIWGTGKVRVVPKQMPPTTAEEGALIRYIQREAAAGHEFFNRTCFTCPRVLFGSLDDSPNSTLNRQVEKATRTLLSGVVAPDRLDTLRYTQYANPKDRVTNGLSKAILDISRINVHSHFVDGVHRPLKAFCPTAFIETFESLLTVNHYLGSWEAYSFRDDSRRGGVRHYDHWKSRAQRVQNMSDTTITPWIEGFVHSVGRDKARELLQGTGLPRGYQNPLTTEWSNKAAIGTWDALEQLTNISSTAR